MDMRGPAFVATLDRLKTRYGPSVVTWWQDLPRVIDRLVDEWGLILRDPVGRGNSSLVIRCSTQNGQPRMLKLMPDHKIASAEAKALRRFAAVGRAPAVREFDADVSCLLMDRVFGAPIADGPAPSLAAIGELLSDLHGADASHSRPIENLDDRVEFMFEHWSMRYGSDSAALAVTSAEGLDRAWRLAIDLVATTGSRVLLHGDLHPGNVLRTDAGALQVIDPRACIGDAAFDAVDWVYWPTEDPAVWPDRCTQLSEEMGVDPERIWQWCRVFAPMVAGSAAVRRHPESRVSAYASIAP